MERFYLKNGKEVKVGEVISLHAKSSHPVLGEIEETITTTVTKELIPKLMEMGILTTSVKEKDVPKDVNYYIERIAHRMNWEAGKVTELFVKMQCIYPMAVFGTILREIAVEFDKKYSDHIENSAEIYVVSSLDGRITKANKAQIKNYRNFAAFRSLEDARTACKILREYLKVMYAKK